jgi:hypothetical protein
MKNETRFTPGPWRVHGGYIVSAELDNLATFMNHEDANLIAAAPDMYAALERARIRLSADGFETDRDLITTIEAVLKKAMKRSRSAWLL